MPLQISGSSADLLASSLVSGQAHNPVATALLAYRTEVAEPTRPMTVRGPAYLRTDNIVLRCLSITRDLEDAVEDLTTIAPQIAMLPVCSLNDRQLSSDIYFLDPDMSDNNLMLAALMLG